MEVDRAGTNPGSEVFNSNNPVDFLHSKTYSIVPENNNPNGTYDITLYYEEAEVVAWENATGNSRNDAQIIKVENSAISAVSPSNFSSFSVGSAAANVGVFNANITYTASFNTGFSGFGMGKLNTVVTGTENILVGVNIYPNPSTGQFVITGLDKGSTYRVIDMSGKLIITEQTVSGNHLVKLPSTTPPGSYMLIAEQNGSIGKVQFILSE